MVEYKNELSARVGQVLKVLNIKADYSMETDSFKTEKYDVLCGDINKDPEKLSFTISEDGQIQTSEGLAAEIAFCKKCSKFYFTRGLNRKSGNYCCPDGHAGESKLLTNRGRIPKWFGNKNEKKLIDAKEAQKMMRLLTGETERAVSPVIDQLKEKPVYITMTKEKYEQVKDLRSKYPNMKEVLDYLDECFDVMSLKQNKNISFRPFVLLGGPGCGKSAFLEDLCRILMGRPALKIDLGNGTSDFAITGSEPSYKSAKCGAVVQAICGGTDKHPIWNPIIHFDELDKMRSNGEKYSIETVFYSILEKSNSRRFYDNFISLNVDASGVNYVFTANSLDNIPKPIINRLKVFKIENYTVEQFKECVLDSFYKNWIKNNEMDEQFLPEKLSDYIKDKILEFCNGDARSVEESMNRLVSITSIVDEKTGHKIALFSPEEMYLGWEKFRGKKSISKETWELPDDFLGRSDLLSIENLFA